MTKLLLHFLKKIIQEESKSFKNVRVKIFRLKHMIMDHCLERSGAGKQKKKILASMIKDEVHICPELREEKMLEQFHL